MPFFQLLTISPRAIPLRDLGDLVVDDRIRCAIKIQNKNIMAQSLT